MAQCDAVWLPEKNRGEKGGRGKVEEDVKGTKKNFIHLKFKWQQLNFPFWKILGRTNEEEEKRKFFYDF